MPTATSPFLSQSPSDAWHLWERWCWKFAPVEHAASSPFDTRTGILYSRARSKTMPIDTTYTNLRENLAAVLDRVADDQEVVIVRRRGAKDVALIAADELNSLLETAHLLRSPRNAQRLRASIQEARQGKGRRMSLKQLRQAVGLDAED